MIAIWPTSESKKCQGQRWSPQPNQCNIFNYYIYTATNFYNCHLNIHPNQKIIKIPSALARGEFVNSWSANQHSLWNLNSIYIHSPTPAPSALWHLWHCKNLQEQIKSSKINLEKKQMLCIHSDVSVVRVQDELSNF